MKSWVDLLRDNAIWASKIKDIHPIILPQGYDIRGREVWLKRLISRFSLAGEKPCQVAIVYASNVKDAFKSIYNDVSWVDDSFLSYAYPYLEETAERADDICDNHVKEDLFSYLNGGVAFWRTAVTSVCNGPLEVRNYFLVNYNNDKVYNYLSHGAFFTPKGLFKLYKVAGQGKNYLVTERKLSDLKDFLLSSFNSLGGSNYIIVDAKKNVVAKIECKKTKTELERDDVFKVEKLSEFLLFGFLESEKLGIVEG